MQDNDPRAIARRNPQPKPPTARANIHGVGGGSTAPGRGPAGAVAGPLDQVAQALGIAGQTVEIPAIARLPARQVPLVHLLLLGILSLFIGWQVLAIAALLHIVSGISEQPAGRAPPGRQGATLGGSGSSGRPS